MKSFQNVFQTRNNLSRLAQIHYLDTGSSNKAQDTRIAKRKILIFLFLSAVAVCIFYWYVKPAIYDRPLASVTELAATFGEVRHDHFHLGLDIRTGGKENLPVYALSDGFISRASIQADGYGKALYVAYPNGMTAVYAHLNTFLSEVEVAVSKQQYLQESWEQEIFFPQHLFPVKKGMIIAYTGNSGSSEGPHLHFELRNTNTKALINPVVAGMHIRDKQPPAINSVFLYSGTYSFYQIKGFELRVGGGKGNHQSISTIQEWKDSLLRIGIEASDRQNNPKFRLGIYEAQMFFDDKLQFGFRMDSIPLTKSRYVNATIDYGEWIRSQRCIQLMTCLAGNRLPSYQRHKSKGILNIADGRVHHVKIIVKDASGNSSSISFPIRFRPSLKFSKYNEVNMLHPGKADNVTTRNAVVYFSPFAFYDSIPLRIKESPPESPAMISPLISLFDASVPVHTRYRIQLKTTLRKNDVRRDYVLMELTSGSKKLYFKGEWEGDYMDGKFQSFGKIRLIIDTLPPVIKAVNWKASNFSAGSILRFECLDNYGPAKNFRAELDGKWIPFEQKGNLFYYTINESLRKGKHELLVQVCDTAGNRKRVVMVFKLI